MRGNKAALKQERDIYWDIIKGIAIVLMVFGHTVEYGSGMEYRQTVGYFGSRVFQYIYAFHMPLFMIVSGYLFWNTVNRKTTVEVILGKLKGVGLPIVSFAVLTFLLFHHDFSGGISDVVVRFFNLFTNTLWFLWAVLICSLLVLSVNRLLHDGCVAYAILLVVLLFVPGKWFAPYVFMYPFFVSGYLCSKYGWLKALDRYQVVIVITSLILFSGFMQWYSTDSLVYTSGTFVLGELGFSKHLVIDVLRWLTGFAGVIFVLSAVRGLYQKSWTSGMNKVVSFMGRRSMGIYCFNAIICAVYYHFTRSYLVPSIGWWIVGCMIMMAAGIVATVVCEKIKPLRIALLGGR